jgi:predicted nucleic acid-binding protein
MTRLLLIDKSAYVRGGAKADLDGELCLCSVSRLELLFSARSPADYMALEGDLDCFRELRMDAETFATANTAQRDLARKGNHRAPLPDLLIAACAQQHAADIVHVDRHFDVLSSVLHFNSIRL